MTKIKSSRLLWLLWAAALMFLINVILYPVSDRLSRVVGMILLVIVWFGLVALLWKTGWLRNVLLAMTFLACVFAFLPQRKPPPAHTLRSEYSTALRRYDGVPYYWGGESIKGIDCSGLVRRGLIDSTFWRGIRTLDAGLVRHSARLWWRDITAEGLGQGQMGLTAHLMDARSINTLDHSKIVAGDLAVTLGGTHILAYLGDNQWIEADPGEERVIILSVPDTDNPWLKAPVSIVRWTLLSD
jgi:hypothetical protein